MLRYGELAPYDTEVLEVCLAALGTADHPAKPLLKGRLAVADADVQPSWTSRPAANLSQPSRPSVSAVTGQSTLRGASMTRINLTVDGAQVSDDVEPRMLLVQYLREKLGKTGTVIGCDTSNCGACTVHLDGESVKSCNVLAVQADGARGHHDRGAVDQRDRCTRCRRRSASATACSAASARRG